MATHRTEFDVNASDEQVWAIPTSSPWPMVRFTPRKAWTGGSPG
jgi:hypothetical protein